LAIPVASITSSCGTLSLTPIVLSPTPLP
jgi:hypothetical protein